MAETILITGASGFIGRRLRRTLLEQGHDVVAIRRPGSPPSEEGRTVEASYGDLDRLKAIMAEEKPNRVFHVAGVTKGLVYDDFAKGNVLPTQNLLRALESEHPSVSRFVHVSSQAAYGPSPVGSPLGEDAPRRPIEHYGVSKLESEQVVEDSTVPWTIVRPSVVYGPGDVDAFELFRLAYRRLNVFYGNRKRWFSSIYVDDCVRAILEASESPNAVGKGYFLTDDVPLTWERFQGKIQDAVGKKTLTVDFGDAIVKLVAVAGEVASRIDGKARIANRQKVLLGSCDALLCTSASAREDFGFECQVTQEEAIRRTHAWYLDNGWY